MNTHRRQLIYSYSFTLLFSVRHKYRSTFVIFLGGRKEKYNNDIKLFNYLIVKVH